MSRQQHATDENIESYIAGRLGEAESETLESHLLICPECRERVIATERFTAAMRKAAARALSTGLYPAPASIPSKKTRSMVH